MSFIRHVALVPYKSGLVTPDELSAVAAALQKQATRDLGPIWDIDATVDAFPTLDEVPYGYWPVIIGDENDVPDGAEGIHYDNDNQPYAAIRYEPDLAWSLTASHEMIEMLIDPMGNHLVPGKTPSQAKDQGRVLILVEACDPVEDADCAYTVNNILVSDFYTPHFFDPEPINGVRYDFCGKLTSPRFVLPGGYITWKNPGDNHYYQIQYPQGGKPTQIDLGILEGRRSIREAVDHHPRTMRDIYSSKLSKNAHVIEAYKEHEKIRKHLRPWQELMRSEAQNLSKPFSPTKP